MLFQDKISPQKARYFYIETYISKQFQLPTSQNIRYYHIETYKHKSTPHKSRLKTLIKNADEKRINIAHSIIFTKFAKLKSPTY